MQDWLSTLLTRSVVNTTTSDRVTLGDIEARLRSLGSNAQQVVNDSKQNAIAAGVIGTAVLVASAYLHGRRRGRRRATVLEIRRV